MEDILGPEMSLKGEVRSRGEEANEVWMEG